MSDRLLALADCSEKPCALLSPVLSDIGTETGVAFGALGPNRVCGGDITMPELSPVPLNSPKPVLVEVALPCASACECEVVRAKVSCSAYISEIDVLRTISLRWPTATGRLL